jgi:hypothetical protein
MKRIALLLGLLCFLASIVFLIHPDVTYHKHDEIAKIGPITATVQKRETSRVPVAATGTLLIAGVLLIVFGSRSK